MGEQIRAALEKATWLRRMLRVYSPCGEYQIEYSGRSLVHERIVINGRLRRQQRIRNWFRPVFRFFAGSRPAAIVLRVWPWLTIRSFHLVIDNQVLYCDHRRDLFEKPTVGVVVGSGANAPTDCATA